MLFLMMIFFMLFNLLFFFSKHPLTMGLNLMIQTLLISLFSGMMNSSFWFSYSLFLIFMGGMLIIFIYMTSLASNEMFNFSMNFKFLLFMFFFFIFLLFLFLIFDYKNFYFNFMNNNETMKMSWMMNLTNNLNLMLNKMFNFPTNIISILLINYLFLTLIISVKITMIFKGPLRPTN